MSASHRIGFMQGRLSPLVDGKIQAFPWNHWKDEFVLAGTHDLAVMEWTLDYDRLEENPLMLLEGRQEIKDLCQKNGIKIPSLTGDFLMQKPFFKAADLERDHLFSLFLKVIEACPACGIDKIIFPLVDNGRLDNKEQRAVLLTHLNKINSILEEAHVQICFEIDLPPQEVALFIDALPADLFAINYDIGNSAALGYDYYEELKAYGKRVTNIHVKDRRLGGTTVPLGYGDADIRGVIREFENEGYLGNYILQTARSTDERHVQVLCEYRDIVKTYVES